MLMNGRYEPNCTSQASGVQVAGDGCNGRERPAGIVLPNRPRRGNVCAAGEWKARVPAPWPMCAEARAEVEAIRVDSAGGPLAGKPGVPARAARVSGFGSGAAASESGRGGLRLG